MPSSNDHTHAFTKSPNATPAVYGPEGRVGIANKLDDCEIDNLNLTKDRTSTVKEEEQLLADCDINITEIEQTSAPSSSYGAINKDGNNDENEHTRLVSKTWDDAVHNHLIQTTTSREVLYQAHASLTLAFTFLLQYSLPVASIFSVGHLGRTQLGAASLASMTANITGFAVIEGMATCMDTLCAQAHGAKLYHQVGEHFQKCTLMILLYFLPVSVLWTNAQVVLALFVDDPELINYAATYLRIVICGIPGYVLFECGKRYLQAQGIYHASTLVLIVAAPLNAALNYLLVWDERVGMGFVGAPLAVAISSWVMAGLLFLFVVFVDGSKCWGGFSRAILKHWGEMLRLAIPGVLMVEAEFLAFEIATLASARLGTVTLATQSIIMSTMTLFWQVPFAVGIAASTRIANFVGASLASSAKKATVVAFGISVFIAFMDCFLMYYFRYFIGHAVSSDPDVINLVAKTIPAILFCHFFDVFGTVLGGIIRGIGRQGMLGYLNLGTYYIIALPLALYLTFFHDLQLFGLWFGLGVGLLIVAVCEFAYLLYCNWDAIIQEAEARQASHESANAPSGTTVFDV